MLRKRGYVVKAFPGEGELQSMMNQQQQQGFKDSQYIYKADGVVRSKSSDEVLVLETSSADNSTSNKKVSFDHYEAMFSLLAMMKTLAEEWEYAFLDHLEKLKLHFIHAHGKLPGVLWFLLLLMCWIFRYSYKIVVNVDVWKRHAYDV